MNVAIIIDNLNGGGAERVAQYLGNHLLKQGVNVYYFLLNKSRTDVYEVSGEIVDTGLGRKLAGFGSDKYKDSYIIFQCGQKLKKYKKQYGIDISISFMEMCNFLNVASKCNDRVILTIHTTLSARSDYHGTLYDHKNIRKVCERADTVVAVSEYIKADLVKDYCVKESKLVVIPNTVYGVDKNVDSGSRISGNSILCVGRLVGVKQHDRILRAFSYVRKRNKEVKLYVLGTGSNLDYLKYIAQKLGIDDSVFFMGFCNNMGNYYSGARALVMASMAEGFPNVMVEAMTYGAPVITTDSPGGCGEIVGKTMNSSGIQYCDYGILTPYIKGKAPRSSELEPEEILLGEAMLNIIDNDGLYKRYHEASLKRAEYYSEEKVMKMWEQLIGI
ncbi:glycosyltransferase [Butyrivibrio sp. AE3006]|uniref:glycosyltransferase n=1 Tax=Butyrivibrio sp. AE3006 TaxID=1280673 RepID=UPI000405B28D|nr:glycosyltransferase [Butyrivibrio sp. AE3006]